MNRLTIEHFLYATDFELCQYMILDCLKNYERDFFRNKLYPGLSELSELNLSFKDILSDDETLNDLFVERYNRRVGSDENVIVEEVKMSPDQKDRAMALISWAQPFVQEMIDEGKIVYEFVKKNIKIEEIGIISSHKEEGYLIVPDNRESVFHLHRYEIKLSVDGKKTQRKLNTQYLQSIERASLDTSPESTILELFEQYSDMPNSATYMCTTDLDFPFMETILPVAKRKLMSRMAA
ncbi:MAG: hypothetical protein ACM3SM_14425 [Bacteroidota bacterium]